MKLINLFEATQDEICDDYILANCLYGNLRDSLRDEFAAFYKKHKGQPKIAKYFLERKLSVQTRKNFLHDNEDELKRTEVKGGVFDSMLGIGFTIYIYDFAGPPPFSFKRNKEIYDFGIFNNCATLTEYPSWFPNNINQYQQVGTSIQSLKNIHKVIESCQNMYFGKDETIKGVSYLAEVKNLSYVEFSNKKELTETVNSYLKNTSEEERNIFGLQDYLIDNGFKDCT